MENDDKRILELEQQVQKLQDELKTANRELTQKAEALEELLGKVHHVDEEKVEDLLDSVKEQERDYKNHYDALTGLPAYHQFIDMVDEYLLMHGKKGHYCVYSDFSNFQYLNEVYGYEEGDYVLQRFAESLMNEYADGIMFCRVTSDHFIGIIYEEDLEQAKESYLAFTSEFTKRCNEKYDQCNLVIVSGIYEITENDRTVASMLDKANDARKMGKEQKVKTSVVLYTDQIKYQTESVKHIVGNMVSAYNNKEFYAYLQPKVSLKTGRIIGAEALVRWIRSDGTKMMPAQFIDIFERNGFITQVDFCVLEQVVEYLEDALLKQEEVVPVSVNFSRRHNETKGFVTEVFQCLETHHVPNNLLEAEVTESVFMSDLSQLDSNLKKFRSQGVEISVDDFGSGYSSLNILGKVDVDTIKLDKQFLDSAAEKENAVTVIKYLIKMLKHLGFKVLAEGVETGEQLQMLKEADCDVVQGYYYAKPMPIHEFRQFLKEFNQKAVG